MGLFVYFLYLTLVAAYTSTLLNLAAIPEWVFVKPYVFTASSLIPRSQDSRTPQRCMGTALQLHKMFVCTRPQKYLE